MNDEPASNHNDRYERLFHYKSNFQHARLIVWHDISCMFQVKEKVSLTVFFRPNLPMTNETYGIRGSPISYE